MSDEIKELAQWLRENGQTLQDALGLKNVPFRLTSAADALEAMAGEVERLRGLLRHAELDCYKARFALQTIGESHVPDQPASSGLTELEHVQHHHKQLRHLAIMTLRPEAVGIFAARPPLRMRASLQDEYRAKIVGIEDELLGWKEAAELANNENAELRAERDRLKAALVRLRDCDWVIRLPDRMDGVRRIAREALEAKEADPAPVVCEWTNASGRTVSTCMPDGLTPDGLMAWGWNGGNHGKCPNCGNRRKFKEAKE